MTESVPSPSFPRGMALLVAGAFFMEILDASIIAPAIPAIATSFGVAAVDVNVAISAYLVTVAVLIPCSGWLADRFGIRPVFLTAIAVFTVASLGCALSPSLPMLVGMRVAQGLGGALMVPVGRLAVLRFSAKTDLVRAIALLTWPALAAPVVAPALGGAIATLGSWRWIFFVNIPIGLVGFLLALRLIRGEPAAPPVRPFDWQGLLFLGGGIGASLIAVEQVRASGTSWPAVAAGVLVGSVCLAIAGRHLRRSPSPLIRLAVLRVRTLRVSVTGGSVYRLVVTAVPFLLPLLFQLEFGWSPFAAGLMVTALFLGNLTIKPVTTPLMSRWGIKRVLLITGIVSVAWFGMLAVLRPGMSVAVMVLILYISGALRSIGFTAYASLAFADVDGEELTHANTLNAAVQELAAGLGIALAALTLTVLTSFAWTFVVLGAVLALSLVETVRLPADAGAHVTGTS